jgi:hypothetical protein
LTTFVRVWLPHIVGQSLVKKREAMNNLHLQSKRGISQCG